MFTSLPHALFMTCEIHRVSNHGCVEHMPIMAEIVHDGAAGEFVRTYVRSTRMYVPSAEKGKTLWGSVEIDSSALSLLLLDYVAHGLCFCVYVANRFAFCGHGGCWLSLEY